MPESNDNGTVGGQNEARKNSLDPVLPNKSFGGLIALLRKTGIPTKSTT
jgi:hypothetical protein